MKLKNLVQLAGFRERTKRYPYEINDFDLGNGTLVHYAQWLHPNESKKSIDIETVDAYREILKEGDFCIDIGAHTGDSTIPMAEAVKNEWVRTRA